MAKIILARRKFFKFMALSFGAILSARVFKGQAQTSQSEETIDSAKIENLDDIENFEPEQEGWIVAVSCGFK